MPDRLYTISQVCEKLGHGRTRVYELLREGRLPSVIVGPRARRVRESDLNAFIASLDDGGLSRRAQGLPRRIEDDAALEAAATLLADPLTDLIRERMALPSGRARSQLAARKAVADAT